MSQNPEHLRKGALKGSSVNEHHGTTWLSKSNVNIRYQKLSHKSHVPFPGVISAGGAGGQ